jgi:hypothetical protein
MVLLPSISIVDMTERKALSEDCKLIKEWFDLVRNTIQKYGIFRLLDIWNFDERGFAMGVNSSQYTYVLRNTM